MGDAIIAAKITVEIVGMLIVAWVVRPGENA
jgi:hypothetical protein